MKKINWPGIVTTSVFGIFLLSFIVTLYYLNTLRSGITEFVGVYGYFAILGISFFLDMIMQPIGPDLPIAVGVVGGLNPFIVLGAAVLGSYSASLLGYYLGGKYGEKGFVKWYGQKKYDELTKKYYKRAEWIVALGALTPVPYVPVCWLAGIFEMKKRHFYIFALLFRTLRFVVIVIIALYFTNLIKYI